MKKCEFCGSIWVCWNWTYVSKKQLIKLNPYQHGLTDEYGHECWKCDRVQNITEDKVLDGIPYKVLRYLFRYLHWIIK